jgi:hypothetical protein
MKRDVSADRHDTWGGDAMDADGTSDERAPTRTAKSYGPDLPTLGSSLAVMTCKATVAIKPGHRGECV